MSSPLYPLSQQYSPSFREQYGINQPLLPSEYPSWHTSSNPPPSPYPMVPDTSAALPQGIRSVSAAPSRSMRSSSIFEQPSSASAAQPSSASPIPSVTLGSLNLSPSASSSASAAPSIRMRSSSLEPYDVVPSNQTQQYLAPIAEYNQPLAASYYQQPPAFVDDPFPALEELPSLSLTDLTGVRERLNKTIKSITGQINLTERNANTQQEIDLLNYRKGYKNKIMEYKRNFEHYFKQRRKTGRGIYFYNSPHELLHQLELLDGSLRAGHNGALPEYTQIAHHLRDIGTISNTQLNSLLRKVINNTTK